MRWRGPVWLMVVMLIGSACASSAIPVADAVVDPDSGDGVSQMAVPEPVVTTLVDSAPSSQPAPVGYELVWSDEFDGEELNRTNWGYEEAFFGAGDDSDHVYDSAAVSVADGVLEITASRLVAPLVVDDDGDGTPDRELTWQSGFITSRERLDFMLGRFEIRMRPPTGMGLWPAFWLRPSEASYGAWPKSGELDVVEILGHEAEVALVSMHWWDETRRQSPMTHDAETTEDGFHVYAMEWAATGIVWFVDGVQVHRVDTWKTSVADYPAPFDREFYLNINLAVGGRWPGHPDGTTPDGVSLDVDWVRVFQLPS